ncbi:UTP--glucose-1-phosphate uridylyltransferase [compost metagenome]
MSKNTIAIIPAAGRGSRMLALTDDMPKIMLPLHNRPLIAWHLDKLLEEDITEVCLVVGYKKEKLIEYVDRFYADKMTIFYAEQEELNGLASAVNIGINLIEKHVDLKERNLLIILGDTIVKDDLSKMIEDKKDFIGYYNVEDYKRWCLVKTNQLNEVIEFVDKPDADPKTRKAVIGVYFFTDIRLLQNHINYIIEKNIKIKNEYQLSSAMVRYMVEKPIGAKKFLEWFDCGDVETFSKTRKNIARHFNSVQVTEDNTIIKKSTNEKKLEKEVNWFLNIPNKLRVYAPQLIDYNTTKGKTSYELEYINFSPIHELFLYTMPELSDWEKLLKNIFTMIERFNLHSSKARFNTDKHLKDILITKTEERINELINGENGEYWQKLMQNSSIKINGKVYKNYPLIDDALYNYCHEVIIPTSKQNWQIIHGDLFFGNMLYDVNSDTLKIIDPRGNFGVDGIYGDIRYDIAKLNHSIVGKYDFIVNSLYAITHEKNNEFEYILYDSDVKHQALESLFKKYVEEFGFDYNVITVMTGLLFLSMIPLHKENFENQKMFYLTAIQIFNKTL